MARRERRKFTDEFKAGVVALVRSAGKSIEQISCDLDLTETAVREWVRRAEVDGGVRDGLTTAFFGSPISSSRLREGLQRWCGPSGHSPPQASPTQSPIGASSKTFAPIGVRRVHGHRAGRPSQRWRRQPSRMRRRRTMTALARA